MVRQVALILWMLGAHDRGVLAGIARFVRAHEPWSLTIASQWLHQPEGVLSWHGHGLIGHLSLPPMSELVASLRVPAVNISEAAEHLTLPSVITDSQAVGRLAAQHLLDAGCTNFAYWGPATHHHFIARGQAFERRLAEAGFPCAWAPAQLDLFDLNVPPPALADWIKSLPKPVAIFACSDVTGRHVVDTCHHHGVHVPEQVAVLGVDNDELLCELAAVQLSSVAVPTERKGYEAAHMLHRLLLGETVDSPIIIQPAGVVTRQSSDLRAMHDPVVGQALKLVLQQPATPLNVADLLEKLPISRRSLERRFRSALGRAPSAEIRRLHLERAKRLLEQTDLTVTQVAAASGFTDINRLCLAFRQHAGMTPSAYRQQMSRGLHRRRAPTDI